MNQELTVFGMSVSLDDSGRIVVSGSGTPDGATVTVTVKLVGGGIANNSGTVAGGTWQITVNLTGGSGTTGEVEAIITDSGFPDKEGVGYLNFELR
jgi:hypothetical protein